MVDFLSGKPLPILSFPAVQLLGTTVRSLVADSSLQALAMKTVADRVDTAASVSPMDLSVEAEAFGAAIRFSEREVPTVINAIAPDLETAEALAVPSVGSGRTGVYLQALSQAKGLITDRPVLAGMIGPFSLAGRLMGVSDIMANCYEDPDAVRVLMRKTTEFLCLYAAAYKRSGADGIVMAEPLSGMLSPALEHEFSAPFSAEVISAVKAPGFSVIYHNCGSNTPKMLPSLVGIGATAYHFGDCIDLEAILRAFPADIPVLGNISPAECFLRGTPEAMNAAVLALKARCGKYPNFILSSGCDIPPMSPWENIEAFMNAAAL